MFIDIQDEIIKLHNIKIDTDSKCWSRTHAHVKERRVCKWKQSNSIQSTFTLLHEIGHIVCYKSGMRRCEDEYHATIWCIRTCKEYGLKIPSDIIGKYQKYIYCELDRGLRRGGANYPSRQELSLYAEYGGKQLL